MLPSSVALRPLAQAKSKLAAATNRHEIDGVLARLASPPIGAALKPKPTIANPYVTNVAALLKATGVAVTLTEFGASWIVQARACSAGVLAALAVSVYG